MNVPRIEIDYPSIALFGRFKPGAVKPSWLRERGLMRPEEAKPSKGFADDEDSMCTASWLQLEVWRDLFWATTRDAVSARPLRDLVLGIFRLLPEVPVRRLAVSRHLHFVLPRAGGPDGPGATPTEGEVWDRRVAAFRKRAVFIRTTDRKRKDVFRDIVIDASRKVKRGIRFTCSQHHRTGGREATRKLLQVLDNDWDCSLDLARELGQGLIHGLMVFDGLDSEAQDSLLGDAAASFDRLWCARDWEPEARASWEQAEQFEEEVFEELERGFAEEAPEVHELDDFVRPARRTGILRECEGTVKVVCEELGEFSATVRDLAAPDNPEEELTFRLQDVPASDHALLAPGGVFYWTVGHEERKGEPVSFSRIRFRRLPPATAQRSRGRRKGSAKPGKSPQPPTADPGADGPAGNPA